MAKATGKSKASAPDRPELPDGAAYDGDGRILSVPIPPELLEQIRKQQAEAQRERALIDWANARRDGMLREPATSGGSFVNSKSWIFDEAQRMKAAGEIPAGIRRTPFAKKLADRMRKAARRNPSIRPIGWKSISNQLPSWGLWPTTKI